MGPWRGLMLSSDIWELEGHGDRKGMGTGYINNWSCINRFYDSIIQRNDSTLYINENTPPVGLDKLKKKRYWINMRLR